MTATIDATGGTLSIPGVLTLTIPPGALAQPTTLSVAPIAPVLFGQSALSGTYLFEPAGTTFAIPAQLDFFIPTGFSGLTTGAEVRWGPTVDQAVGLATTVLSDRVRAQVTHFTVGYVRIPTPPALSTATCQIAGAGLPSQGCSGLDAGEQLEIRVPEPFDSELMLECSVASPVATRRPRPGTRAGGFGVSAPFHSPLQGVAFSRFDGAGARVGSTANVTNTVYQMDSGDWVEAPNGELLFATTSSEPRPGTTQFRHDLRVWRTDAMGTRLGNAVVIPNDALCPGNLAPDAGGAWGAAGTGPTVFQPRIVYGARGPIVVWLERWTINCNVNGGVMMRLRAVWLNHDLSVRVGPIDVNDMWKDQVSDFAIAADGDFLAIATAGLVRYVPVRTYNDDRILLWTFFDGQPTTTTPTIVAGCPCPDHTDPTGLNPATTINLPDGGTQCLGTRPWSQVSVAAKPGVAVVTFSSGGGLHLAAMRLETGALANQPIMKLETGFDVRRHSIVATPTGYSVAAIIDTAYADGTQLSYTPLSGGVVGGGVLFTRLNNALQFRDSPTLLGLSRYGISEPPSVATGANEVSVVSWTDAPKPRMGTGPVWVRQKAAVLTCP